MTKKFLSILQLGSVFLCAQAFSNDCFHDQLIKSFENRSFLCNLQNTIDCIDDEIPEDFLYGNFEVLCDLALEFFCLNKEDKTRSIIFIVSDEKICQLVTSMFLNKQLSQEVFDELNSKTAFILEWLDINLLKKHLTELAISLNLNETIVENSIDQRNFVKLFVYLMQIPKHKNLLAILRHPSAKKTV